MTYTFPERSETIEVQFKWLSEGKRGAVLVPYGTRLPVVPAGMMVWAGKLGLYVYNVLETDAAAIKQAEAEDRIGDILGYGIAAKPEKEVGAVVLRGPDGLEKQAVVTDAEHFEEVMAAANELAEPGDVVALEPCDGLLQRRLPKGIESGPTLRLLRKAEQLVGLMDMAAADNHRVVAPTFLIEKNGEVVGYIGLNSLPTFQGWFHTKKMNARDSLSIFNQVENLCRMQGMQQLALLLPLTSGFIEHTERLGYQELATVSLQLKQLT